MNLLRLLARLAGGSALCIGVTTVAMAAAAPAAPAPFLWTVQGPKATHYLLGSVHLLPVAADALPDALEDAYTQVDGVVFETDIGALAARTTQLGFVAAGQAHSSLRGRIGTALYARVQAQAAQLNMPPGLCDRVQAWWCALSLALYEFRDAGFSEEYGIDQHFYGEALADGKALRWLEGVPQHLALFTGMDAATGRALLRAALEPDSGGLGSPQAVYGAWRSDDDAALAGFDVRFAQRAPVLYERLIRNRNRAWLPRLRTLLEGGQAQLVVVGAAHLVGPDGLVAALRAAGYRVTPGLAAPQRGVRTAARAGVRPVAWTPAP